MERKAPILLIFIMLLNMIQPFMLERKAYAAGYLAPETIRAEKNTYIDNAGIYDNDGLWIGSDNSPQWPVRGFNFSNARAAFQFDLSGIKGPIYSATFRFNVSMPGYPDVFPTARLFGTENDDWTEDLGGDRSNFPSANTSELGREQLVDGPYSIDVTDFIKSRVGNQKASLILTGPSSGSSFNRITDNTTADNSRAPRLSIVYINPFEVTFDAGEGIDVIPDSQTKLLGSTYGKGEDGTTDVALPVPSPRTGYTFDGWYTHQTGGARVTEDTVVTTASNHDLYGRWSANSYDVTFNAGEGNVDITKQTKRFDSPYGKGSDGTTNAPLPTPTRSGFDFLGWYTEPNGEGTHVTDETLVTIASAHTLYAHWIGNTFIISFDAGEGSVNPTEQTKLLTSTYGKGEDGSTDAPLPIPTRVGYIFGGWYNNEDFEGEVITNSTEVTVAADHTLYAKWTIASYNVIYEGNGSTSGSTPGTLAHEYNTSVNVAEKGNLEKAGYSFVDWNTVADGSGDAYEPGETFTMGTEEVILHAQWRPNPYTITLDPTGGSVNPTEQTKLYDSVYGKGEDGQTNEALPTPTRDGYDFAGWYTEENGAGAEITDTATVEIADNHTLYANWTAKQYKITFDAGEGNVNITEQTKLFDAAYGKGADGTTEEALPTPTRIGYTFGGWYDNEELEGTVITNQTVLTTAGDHTLYAKWTINSYEVIYRDNGAKSGSVPSTLAHEYNTSVNVAEKGDLEKTGYSFVDWNTEADGSGDAYEPGDTFTMGTEEVILHAQWTPNPYTITLDPTGGSVTPTEQTKLYDSVYGKGEDGQTNEALPTPTRDGYDFAGWYTEENGAGVEITDTATVEIADNHTLYANWTAKQYKISFDAGEGNVNITEQTKLFDATYGKGADGTTEEALPTPTRIGYTFGGWYDNEELEGTVITNQTVLTTVGDHTLYAKWTINSYEVIYRDNGATSGTVPSTIAHAYNSSVSVLDKGELEKNGYSFVGWNTEADGSGDAYEPGDTFTMGTEEVILHAQWRPNPYTIILDPTGGSVNPTEQRKLYDSVYGKGEDGQTNEALPTPTRDGYDFAGWYIEENGAGTEIVDTTTVEIADNHTLYAHWLAKTYTINFNPTGGVVTPTEQTKLFASTYGKGADGETEEALPIPMREGHTFDGWYDYNNPSFTGKPTTNLTIFDTAADHTLYANWIINSYDVIYKGNGSTSGTAPNTLKHEYNTSVAVVDKGELEKSGYTFTGWNTEADGSGTSYMEGTNFTIGAEDVTLYAQWTPNEYKVSLEPTGGTVTPTEQTKLYDSTYGKGADGSSEEGLPLPEREGYTFSGWYSEEGGAGTEVTDATLVTVAENHTLYAHWTANRYTITLNAGEGEVEPSVLTKLFSSTYGKGENGIIDESLPTPTREGYSFDGWYSSEDLTGKAITDHTEVTIADDHTLYAKWVPVYSVIYHGNKNTSGTVPVDTNLYRQGSEVTVLDNTEDLVRNGYSFVGWNTAQDGTGIDYEAGEAIYMEDDDIVLYAKWRLIPSSGPSQPPRETIVAPVETGTIGSGSKIAETSIIRTREQDGRVRDEVILSSEKTRETVQSISQSGGNSARIIIPDENDEVSQIDIQVPLDVTQEYRENHVSMEIFTDNVRLFIPQQSINNIESDFHFRIIPIKEELERKEIETRAKMEQIVSELVSDNDVNVIARPMKIETNMTNQTVSIILPLRDVQLPTEELERDKFLSELVIFIEHSDGDRKLVKGTIVEFMGEMLGLEFEVNKFSTFTILHIEDFQENEDKSYIKGFSDGTFRPDDNITRAQMAVMLARNLGFDEEQRAKEEPFNDIKSEFWASGVIEFVQKEGLMTGDPNGNFNPSQPITRGQMAVIVARYKGLPLTTEESNKSFHDIEGHWAALEIAAVKEVGIISGFLDGTYRPNQPLTRAQAVKMINRMFEREPQSGRISPTFSDVPPTHWAFYEVEEAASN